MLAGGTGLSSESEGNVSIEFAVRARARNCQRLEQSQQGDRFCMKGGVEGAERRGATPREEKKESSESGNPLI